MVAERTAGGRRRVLGAWEPRGKSPEKQRERPRCPFPGCRGRRPKTQRRGSDRGQAAVVKRDARAGAGCGSRALADMPQPRAREGRDGGVAAGGDDGLT